MLGARGAPVGPDDSPASGGATTRTGASPRWRDSSPNNNQPGRRGRGGVEEGAQPAQTAKMTFCRSAADGGGPPSGEGGRRRDGVPRRGVALPCGEAVPVGGRRRRRIDDAISREST